MSRYPPNTMVEDNNMKRLIAVTVLAFSVGYLNGAMSSYMAGYLRGAAVTYGQWSAYVNNDWSPPWVEALPVGEEGTPEYANHP
jgi:hypothetical protein